MTHQCNLLIVSEDEAMQHQLVELLSTQHHYHVEKASDFDTALDAILHESIQLIIAHNELRGLNAIDLLVVASRVYPDVGYIVIDRDIVPKTALAALRLGALDYLAEPLNLDLLLMQIEKFFAIADLHTVHKISTTGMKETTASDRIDPACRAVTFTLKRNQYEVVTLLLQELAMHTNARFVGLLDRDDNVTAAVGQLEQVDLKLLQKALTADQSIAAELADVLKLNRFQANFYEGNRHSVYSIQLSLSDEREAKLVLICSASEKAGNTWLLGKRIARKLEQVLDTNTQPKPKRILAFDRGA